MCETTGGAIILFLSRPPEPPQPTGRRTVTMSIEEGHEKPHCLRTSTVIKLAALRTNTTPSHRIHHALGSHHCPKSSTDPRKNRSDDRTNYNSYCNQLRRKCRIIRVNLETRAAITTPGYFHLHHPSLLIYCFLRKKIPRLPPIMGCKRGFTQLITS